MNIDEAAELFEGVRWRGTTSFTSRCPAHPDDRASLSVREGHTNIMVHCFAGCTFFEVAAAVGVQPIYFKIGGGSRASGAPTTLTARSRLRQRLGRPELVSLSEVLTRALDPSEAQLARATEAYPTLMEMPYQKTEKMDVVVMMGPVFDLLWDGVEVSWGEGRYYPRYNTRDWFKARDMAGREIRETWRNR